MRTSVRCQCHGDGGLVAEQKVLAVFFFRDPLTAQPHEPDVSALLRSCDVHNVPLATNMASALAVLEWLERHSATWIEHQESKTV